MFIVTYPIIFRSRNCNKQKGKSVRKPLYIIIYIVNAQMKFKLRLMIENNLGLSSAAAAQNNASLCNVYVSASDASA